MNTLPKHNIVPPGADNPLFRDAAVRQIGFSPLTFCEFFQGMDVLQLMGEETKQYVFGLYWAGRLVGTVYFGDLYTKDQVLALEKEFFPPTWDEIGKYVKSKDGVWYSKMHPSQYAFVFENVLKKID